MPTIAPETVRHATIFAGLDKDELQALLAEGRLRHCARGSALYVHGEEVSRFYIIVTGIVQLVRLTPDGQEKTIEILKASDSLCESEIMDACQTHRASAIAVEDLTVMEFPVEWLKRAARKHTPFALNLLSLMADRAHRMELEAEQQAVMSAAQMVACFLQRLCVLHGFKPSGFELPYSKKLIASRLGMETETLSRALTTLRSQGIMVRGAQVQISDAERASQYVCGACSVADTCPTHQAMEGYEPSGSSPACAH